METEIKPGDKFYSSEGYNCTYYDFVVVEKVSPTGKTVIVRKLKKKVIEKFNGGEKVIPTNEPIGDAVRLRKSFWRGNLLLRGKMDVRDDVRNFYYINDREVDKGGNKEVFIETWD